ncbi:MAG: PorV/PorQ family protein [Bacteroidales bacterium]|nr:PorV/PorQ family protein [Bacteroidales bacterium]
MKKTISALCALALFATAARAQSFSLLNLSYDPATLATGVTGEMSPALMYDLKHLKAQVSYGLWSPSSASSSALGVSLRGKFAKMVTVGADFKTFGSKPYEITDEGGSVKGEYKPSEFVVGINAGVMLGFGFSLGFGAHFASSKIAPDASAKPFCFDAAVAYSGKIVQVSMGVYNLGTKFNYGGTESYSLPALVRASGRFVTGPVRTNVELDYLFERAFMGGLGFEYSLKDHFFARAGFHYGGNDGKAIPWYGSVGLGCKFAGVTLDAAYLISKGGLANTFRVALGYCF